MYRSSVVTIIVRDNKHRNYSGNYRMTTCLFLRNNPKYVITLNTQDTYLRLCRWKCSYAIFGSAVRMSARRPKSEVRNRKCLKDRRSQVGWGPLANCLFKHHFWTCMWLNLKRKKVNYGRFAEIPIKRLLSMQRLIQ